METGRRAFVAVDVHYLSSGGARAAAVVAAEARFCEVVAERTEVLAEALPYRPGEFYLREPPPIRAVLPAASSGKSGSVPPDALFRESPLRSAQHQRKNERMGSMGYRWRSGSRAV
jgi:deoxyinosine 3'endonuclease (endonuclease V)